MARSIGEWYENASALGADDDGFDWGSDDLVERTPDTWLDNPGSRATSASPSATPAGGPVVRSVKPASSRPVPPSPAREPFAPDTDGLVLAVILIRKAMKGIDDEGLTTRLRRCGWPNLTAANVRAVIADVRDKKAARQRLTYPTGDLPPEMLVVAVRVLRTIPPRLSSGELARRLRDFGWPTTSRGQVREVLAMTDPVEALAWPASS